MKKILYTFAIIAIALVFAGQMYFGNTAMDIQLYDTYFVFRFSSLIIPLLLISLLLFSLTAALKTRFKERVYNFLALISVLSVFFFACFILGRLT